MRPSCVESKREWEFHIPSALFSSYEWASQKNVQFSIRTDGWRVWQHKMKSRKKVSNFSMHTRGSLSHCRELLSMNNEDIFDIINDWKLLSLITVCSNMIFVRKYKINTQPSNDTLSEECIAQNFHEFFYLLKVPQSCLDSRELPNISNQNVIHIPFLSSLRKHIEPEKNTVTFDPKKISRRSRHVQPTFPCQ